MPPSLFSLKAEYEWTAAVHFLTYKPTRRRGEMTLADPGDHRGPFLVLFHRSSLPAAFQNTSGQEDSKGGAVCPS